MWIGDGREVFMPWIGKLPETCTMHTRLGMDCPGCGLTRSFIRLAGGELTAGWQLNPLGPFLFAFVMLQLPLALAHLQPFPVAWLRRWTRWNEFALVALMVALMLQWTWRMLLGDLA